ncbi:MAG: hypothetical protein ACK5PQ_01170 [Alphaproteobacteria bacterium]
MTHLKTLGTFILFFSLPLVASLKGKGIVVSFLLAFFLFEGPSVVIQFIRQKKWQQYGWTAISYLVFIFLVFAPRTQMDFLHLIRMLALGLIGVLSFEGIKRLPLSDREKISYIFFQGYIFYLVFFLAELYGGHWVSSLITGSLYYNENLFIRGVVILTFLFLPFSWYLVQKYKGHSRQILVGVSALSLLLVVLKAQPSAARLAIALSVSFGILTFFFKRSGQAIIAVVSLYAFLIPVIILSAFNRQTLFDHLHHLPPSYQHRVQIWHEISQHVFRKPLSGHGFGQASKLKEAPPLCIHHKTTYFQKVEEKIRTVPDSPFVKKIHSTTPYVWGGVICYNESILSRHPHNGALQIWLELGLWGIVIGAFLLYKLGQYASKKEPIYRAYLYALGGLALVYWNVSFGLWQNWMITVVALTFLLFQLIKVLPSEERKI